MWPSSLAFQFHTSQSYCTVLNLKVRILSTDIDIVICLWQSSWLRLIYTFWSALLKTELHLPSMVNEHPMQQTVLHEQLSVSFRAEWCTYSTTPESLCSKTSLAIKPVPIRASFFFSSRPLISWQTLRSPGLTQHSTLVTNLSASDRFFKRLPSLHHFPSNRNDTPRRCSSNRPHALSAAIYSTLLFPYP